MKIVKLLFALFAFTILLSSCNKSDDDDLQPTDYLIFGHFYGECMGEGCVEIFKLEDGKLFEDSNDTYPGSSDYYVADFNQLSDELYNQVSDLEATFPAGLLSETAVVIGQPDAGDWGGLYIEYNRNGVHEFWLLDQMKSNVPSAYHDFIDAVNEKIQLINF